MYYLSVAKKAGLPIDVLVQIYLTFIRPILEYASPVWGGLPKHLSDSLESIQKRCLRIIGLPADALPTLANRRERATLRTLESILKDSTSPLWGFITTPLASHYNLRRG
ncbi:N-acetylated-alpha-linked acidic dipeptidase 2, partial [Branchiostoma belcheri]